MLHTELPRVTQRKNRSFAGQKLEILPPVLFREPIQAAANIIFIHPPKTGGTNLVFITEALAKTTSFQAKRFAVPRITNQSPGLIKENWQGGLQAALDALKENPNCCDHLNFISGHFPFGLHQHIKKPSRYVALIRNPIERAISNTNFDFQRGYIGEHEASKYLLDSDIDNPQTRMLAGVAYMQGECNEDTLLAAKQNIEAHFLFIGVTEDTNSFIQILASIQGWGQLALTRSQVTGDKVITELNPAIINSLKEKHKYDCLLYEFVKQHWYAWKNKYVISNLDLTSDKIMCIPQEFASTKQPLFLTKQEIEEYNSKVTDNLVEVTQKHAGVKEDHKSENNKLLFDGLGIAGAIGIGRPRLFPSNPAPMTRKQQTNKRQKVAENPLAYSSQKDASLMSKDEQNRQADLTQPRYTLRPRLFPSNPAPMTRKKQTNKRQEVAVNPKEVMESRRNTKR